MIVALAVATVGSTGLSTTVGSVIGTNVAVSAASSSEVITYGDFSYVLYSDKTASVVAYNGTKDLSSSSLGIPSVLYSKDLNTSWSYSEYISQYTVTKVEAGIFGGCKIRILGLPSGTQAIFGGFTGAEIGCFSISSTNSYYSVTSSGVLYNKSQTELVAYPSKPSLYSSVSSSASFLSTTTSIGDCAFSNSKFTSLTIPASVTYVGDRAFTGSSLVSITFNGSPNFKSLPGTYGDHGTFEGASNLDAITIKGTSGNYATYNGALYNADKSKLILCPQGRTTSSSFVIYNGTTSIGNYAFYKCAKLTAATIPETVTSIGSSAFYSANSSLSLYVTQDTYGYTYAVNNSMPYHIIYSYTKNSDNTLTITAFDGPYTSFSIPSKINGYSVSAIGENAFKSNKNITSVSVPYGVKTIGTSAFESCSNLKTISLPNSLTSVGTYAFGFNGLTSVTIPNGVTTLSGGAFYGCSSLESVTLGTGLKTIGSFAFENTALTSVYIPKNVTSVGSNAFGYKYSSSAHTKVDFDYISGYPDTAAQTYANNNNITFKSLLEYSVSSDGTKVTIDKYTGSDTTVVIPETIGGVPVTAIKSYAFNGTNVTSVTFPSTITSIGSYAFEFCTSLKSITIPNTVTSIGTGAFYGCTSLSSLNLGTGVKTIGKYAFTNTALTSVTVPKSVTTINEHAFAYTYSDSVYTEVDGFTMTGYAYTAAETYAQQNTHITFNPLYESITNTSTISATQVQFGQNIAVNLSATGGKTPFTYSVAYQVSNNTPVTVQSYSTNSSVSFKLPSVGSYKVYAYAKDDRGNIQTKTFNVSVSSTLANTSSISTNSATVGDKVNIYCSATGNDGDCKYSVYCKYPGDSYLTTIQPASTNKSVSLDITKAGDYEITVYTTDNTNTVSKKFTLSAVDKLSGTIQTDKSAVTLGDKITATVNASGGSGSYTYRIFYTNKETSVSTTVQDYSYNNSVEITLPDVGEYEICAYIADSQSRFETVLCDVTVQQPLVNTSSISSTSVELGNSVTVTGNATGGTGGYTYKFAYTRDGISYWVDAEGSDNSCTFVPNYVDTYHYKVTVTDSNGKTEEKVFDVTAKESVQPLANTSSISSTSVSLGNSVTATASAKDGVAPYSYAFYLKKTSETKWTEKQKFGTNSSLEIQPTETVSYDVCIKVKDSKGTIEKSYFTFEVTQAVLPLSNTSGISSTSVALGNSVTATASAKDGVAPYSYAFYLKKTSETKWTEKQKFGTNSSLEIQPTETGSYDVCIKVKDSNGTIEKAYFTFEVTQSVLPLSSTSSISSTSVVLGNPVTATASAEGGTSPYTYAFYLKKTAETKWTEKQKFGTNSSLELQPTETGSYDVCIKVKDSTGTIEKSYFTFEVTQAILPLSSTSSISSASVVLGNSVTATAGAEGGTSPYSYAFYLKKTAETKWTEKQKFGTNSSLELQPTEAGSYDVCIKVKDSTGTIEKSYFTFEVTETALPLSNTSSVSSSSVTLGNSVTATASAKYGTSPYVYAFYTKKTSETKWTEKQAYSTNSSVEFQPTEAGSYDICIKVKDSDGTVEKAYLNVEFTA